MALQGRSEKQKLLTNSHLADSTSGQQTPALEPLQAACMPLSPVSFHILKHSLFLPQNFSFLWKKQRFLAYRD